MNIHKIWGALEINHCLVCGSLQPANGGLCQWCLVMLNQQIPPYHGAISDTQVKALYEWNPQQSDALSHLMHSLKGHQQIKMKFWAQQWIHQWKKTLDENTEMLLVPAPRQSESPDHAAIFARHLSDILGIPLLDVLRLSKPRDQKNKKAKSSREDWSKDNVIVSINDSWTQHILDELDDYRVVFIDDVITTGSTAQRSFEALNYFGKKEVWTIARRTLACG